MEYLLLIYEDEKRFAQGFDPDEFNEYIAFGKTHGSAIRSGKALQPTRAATTVRVRNGKTALSDGPFAETKEQLAGFYLIEARDLNEAIQIAAKIPPVEVGCIEVRPIRPIREQPRTGSNAL